MLGCYISKYSLDYCDLSLICVHANSVVLPFSLLSNQLYRTKVLPILPHRVYEIFCCITHSWFMICLNNSLSLILNTVERYNFTSLKNVPTDKAIENVQIIYTRIMHKFVSSKSFRGDLKIA